MKNENELRIGIGKESIEQAGALLEPLLYDYDLLAQSSKTKLSEIFKLQPDLVRFWRDFGMEVGAHNPVYYAAFLATSYEMVPATARSEVFEEGEMIALRKSLQEYIIDDPNSTTGKSIDFTNLKDAIKSDSGEFVDWLEEIEEGLESEENKSDFVLGSLLGVAPFVFRVEGRKLERQLTDFGKQ